MFKALKFYVDQGIDRDAVLAHLTSFGYVPKKTVSEPGDFTVRGEIIDVFPANFDGPVRVALDADRIRAIHSFNLRSGKNIWDHKIVIFLPHKLRPQGREDGGGAPFQSETPLNHFVDIEQGDYVVHNTYGIGKFLGVQRLESGPKGEEQVAAHLPKGFARKAAAALAQQHIVIEYLGGDRLFVPEKDMHLIQKYVGFNKRPPRLFKLGSKEWQRIKAQIQKKIRRLAGELLHLQAVRASLKGFQFAPDIEWQKEFEARFPFEETPDQITCTAQVKTDMESDHPMDRLLCGDVGFGKTEVAVRAVFKAVMSNKQAAVLVPTTILAEQHYYNFARRMQGYPVNVAMLSRFRTRHQQTETLRGLADGQVDVVIGTHRLLSKDIVFKNLGLIIIDEEQRFGVRAKEKLKHLKLLADVLTMTATPIPRTLYMALSGARDMSVISTPPQNRIPVTSHIVEFDEDLIRQAVERELHRRGQVFFLHNRVEDIDQIARIVQRLVPAARVGVGHGQMPAKMLEKVMLQFLAHEIDILVCTTIIESGIDIPNANTLIVNRADRFGLADLHQLRGRVGRSASQAYAYFIVPAYRALSSESRARLKALEKHSELGAGFQIAFEDLQIRGAGNLLGSEQSGYISAVGFDLYCRLLKESVDHLKQAKELQAYAQDHRLV